MDQELIQENEKSFLPAVVHQDELTPEQIIKQVQKIQTMLKEVMIKDQHFGIIPGCGNKPSLLKPGAEKLCMLFRLAPQYEVIQTDLPGDHREYKVITRLYHIPTGNFVGAGVGCCSTKESKYRYRNASRVCPVCGGEYIIQGKKEYGGGWLCFAKKGGCGAKFNDGDPVIEKQVVGQIENEDPADLYNTCFKMAKKRSHVDATLTATAASDIFAQDLEDLPEVIRPKVQETEPDKPDANRTQTGHKPDTKKKEKAPAPTAKTAKSPAPVATKNRSEKMQPVRDLVPPGPIETAAKIGADELKKKQDAIQRTLLAGYIAEKNITKKKEKDFGEYLRAAGIGRKYLINNFEKVYAQFEKVYNSLPPEDEDPLAGITSDDLFGSGAEKRRQ